MGPVEETTEAEWRAEIDDNLTATFLTLQSVLPGMKARRAGSIVTLSSRAARKAVNRHLAQLVRRPA